MKLELLTKKRYTCIKFDSSMDLFNKFSLKSLFKKSIFCNFKRNSGICYKKCNNDLHCNQE